MGSEAARTQMCVYASACRWKISQLSHHASPSTVYFCTRDSIVNAQTFSTWRGVLFCYVFWLAAAVAQRIHDKMFYFMDFVYIWLSESLVMGLPSGRLSAGV